MQEPTGELLRLLSSDPPTVVLTGAGVSAESGLATFRGPGGHWEGRDPMSLATPEAFDAEPMTVWRFYDWRRTQAASAKPNPAHTAIVDLEKKLSNLTVVTQNVDGLHERAGTAEIIRLHGSLWTLRCTVCGAEREDLRPALHPLPPGCGCGGMLRPGVVWFGEQLPRESMGKAQNAVRNCRLMLVVGTSSLVYPAAAMPQAARAAGAFVVEVNPERTPLTPMVDEHYDGPAGEILPGFVSSMA
ncbi:MAG: NAD-dependent deacylase [Acidobacteria bacterium]|uniref:NAD-dependent protein deacylase n=1 Tax=Candidatus Polarisedimenticola svalbardensis TaxID=2886004 RepID=A0A8J6Y5P2_9BACT|nr:NAD-dependent deacylase [Candidatus Polarisedimenticola svalbardensis]